ncbi:hypothetical protein MSKU9_2729 [Komagataeibacter diospyri]|uniref:Uncharacterized protein n=1 Tax=Komagataeibacter diospyri TaxID=1932662 RepID=A0A4P5NS74_9PROT|nr:hypothetical protein MSKU9_2729 [Komagataeibacter diospyri]
MHPFQSDFICLDRPAESTGNPDIPAINTDCAGFILWMGVRTSQKRPFEKPVFEIPRNS